MRFVRACQTGTDAACVVGIVGYASPRIPTEILQAGGRRFEPGTLHLSEQIEQSRFWAICVTFGAVDPEALEEGR